MTKPAFGIAESLSSGARIYYENIFSQFQIGRLVDLLTAIADGSGVHVPTLRAVLNTCVDEACRHQAMFDSALPSFDPVMIEYGADGQVVVICVSFTFDPTQRQILESLESELANPQSKLTLVYSLRGIAALGTEVVFKADAPVRRAEIFVRIPLGVLPTEPGPVRYVSIEGAYAASGLAPGKDHEYIELGDVEYEKLLDEKPGAAPSQASITKKNH